MESQLSDTDLKIPLDRLVEFASQTGWYHTIELYPGIRTAGTYDHAPHLPYYGFPESMAEGTILDVGTSDGFFAFEFERRGNRNILAVDTNKYDGSLAIDPSPALLHHYTDKYQLHHQINTQFADVYETLEVQPGHQFMAAKVLLNSEVEYKNVNVYNLSALNTKFDFVFCGDLIEHLKHPLLALENLVSVTKKECIIALSSALSHNLDPGKKLGSVRWELMRLFAKILKMPITADPSRARIYGQ